MLYIPTSEIFGIPRNNLSIHHQGRLNGLFDATTVNERTQEPKLMHKENLHHSHYQRPIDKNNGQNGKGQLSL